MDPVSVVLIALVGLALIWVFYRAFSNSHRGPSKKVRGNVVRNSEGYLYDLAPPGITPYHRSQDEGTIGRGNPARRGAEPRRIPPPAAPPS